MARVVDRIRYLTARRSEADASCAELLDRYVATRCESAFAELVFRHGPRVYGLCRRILGDRQLAEDALQATFVVLVKKAATIQPRSAVAGFLYGVARKAALEASAMSRRRQEVGAARLPDPAVPASSSVEADEVEILDQEIANLSEPFRSAVVMCELDGLRRAEAAQRLGISEGTLSSRLAAARKRLAHRLTKRGVALSTTLIAALNQTVNGAVRPRALQGVVESCTSGAVNARAGDIAGEVMKKLLLAKLRVPAFAFLAVLFTTAIMLVDPRTETASAPAAKGTDPGVVWLYNWTTNTLTALRPTGEILKEYKHPFGSHFLGLTPDGQKFVYTCADDSTNIARNGKAGRLCLSEIGDVLKPEPLDIPMDSLHRSIHWTRDGKRFVVANPDNKAGDGGQLVAGYTLAGDWEFRQPIKRHEFVAGWAGDGRRLFVARYDRPEIQKTTMIESLDVASGRREAVLEGECFSYPSVAPDGATFLGFNNFAPPVDGRYQHGPRTYDLATKKLIDLPAADGLFYADGQFSADSKHIVYRWQLPDPIEEGKPITGEWRFVVADRNGQNRRTIYYAKGEQESSTHIYGWFPKTPPDLRDARPSPARTGPEPKAQEPKPDRAAGKAELKALDQRFQNAMKAFQEAAAMEPDVAKQHKLAERLLASNDPKFVEALFDLEKRHRGTDAGLFSLFYLMLRAGQFGDPDLPITRGRETALDLLREHYLKHPDLDLAFEAIRGGPLVFRAAPLLEAATEKSPHDYVRAAALLHQADQLKLKADFKTIRSPRPGAPKPKGRSVVDDWTDAMLLKVADLNVVKARKEAERLARKVVADYAEVKAPFRMSQPDEMFWPERQEQSQPQLKIPTAAERAKSLLFELTQLAVGQPAPGMAGHDCDGKAIQLSDFRGKVVVLMFSANWCGPCKEWYPKLRELQKAVGDKDLAILTVMADRDAATVREAIENKAITWPAIWDGEDAPIAKAWNVQRYPTMYVFDRAGIVRARDPNKDLEAVVADLSKRK